MNALYRGRKSVQPSALDYHLALQLCMRMAGATTFELQQVLPGLAYIDVPTRMHYFLGRVHPTLQLLPRRLHHEELRRLAHRLRLNGHERALHLQCPCAPNPVDYLLGVWELQLGMDGKQRMYRDEVMPRCVDPLVCTCACHRVLRAKRRVEEARP